ncbi:O-antigen/teichoic acid export membrane protein [Aurantimicrobium minutum]|uniref:lipopolysaccharide biosynthesis protein n=1 Tax=Aurantimicrobium minutum TaxID=708131 RepID=UPI0024754002|nr:hypothetical protein [Aurantimicrobium minutum]MDH6278243.1 O-antigen/teichoic acid export membrane protein [Aurantimicrobium minutum]
MKLITTNQTFWLTFSGLLRNAGVIVVLIVLANTSGAASVSEYSLSLAITTPFFIFAQLGLKSLYLTKHADHRQKTYLLVLGVALTFAFIISVAATSIFTPTLIIVVALVAFSKVIDSFSDLLTAPLQRAQKAQFIAVVYGINALFCSVGVIVILTHSLNLVYALAWILLFSIFNMCALLIPVALHTTRKYLSHVESDPTNTRELLRVTHAGLPLGISTGLFALTASVPQYLLAHQGEIDAVGFLSILLYAFGLAELLVGSASQSWIPEARKYFTSPSLVKEFKKLLSKTVTKWTISLIPLFLVGIVSSWFVIPMVFANDYRMTIPITLPLIVSLFLLPNLQFGNIAILVANLYSTEIILALAALVIVLGTGFILIPIWGLPGALWSLTLSSLIRIFIGRFLLGLKVKNSYAKE